MLAAAARLAGRALGSTRRGSPSPTRSHAPWCGTRPLPNCGARGTRRSPRRSRPATRTGRPGTASSPPRGSIPGWPGRSRRSRGARPRPATTSGAAAALRRAAHLTPPGPPRSRRFAAAAGLAHEIGGVELADRLAQEVVPEELDLVGQARVAAMRRRPAETLIAVAEQVDDRRLALKLLWHAATELRRSGTARSSSTSPAAPGRRAPTCERRNRDAGRAGAARVRRAGRREVHRSAALLAQAAEGLREQSRRTARGEVLALASWAQLASRPSRRRRPRPPRPRGWPSAPARRCGARSRTRRWRSWPRCAATKRRPSVTPPTPNAWRCSRVRRRARARPARARHVGAGRGPARRGLRAPVADVRSDRPGPRREAASVLLGDLAEAATDEEERALVRRLAATRPARRA